MKIGYFLVCLSTLFCTNLMAMMDVKLIEGKYLAKMGNCSKDTIFDVKINTKTHNLDITITRKSDPVEEPFVFIMRTSASEAYFFDKESDSIQISRAAELTHDSELNAEVLLNTTHIVTFDDSGFGELTQVIINQLYLSNRGSKLVLKSLGNDFEEDPIPYTCSLVRI